MPKWDVEHENRLGELEKTLTLLQTTAMVAQGWLRGVTQEFAPGDLDDALGRRISKAIWQTTFVLNSLSHEQPLQSFDDIAQFMVQVGVPGLVVQVYDDPEELDEALLASARIRYEKEKEQEDGSSEGEGQ